MEPKVEFTGLSDLRLRGEFTDDRLIIGRIISISGTYSLYIYEFFKSLIYDKILHSH